MLFEQVRLVTYLPLNLIEYLAFQAKVPVLRALQLDPQVSSKGELILVGNVELK